MLKFFGIFQCLMNLLIHFEKATELTHHLSKMFEVKYHLGYNERLLFSLFYQRGLYSNWKSEKFK